MRVMKFGGTSVGSAERMRSVVRLVCQPLADGAQAAADRGETEATSERSVRSIGRSSRS